jgi:DNA primase large subunit
LAVDHVFFKVWTLVLAIYPFSIYIFCSVQKLIPSKSYCNPIKVPFEQVPDLVASRRVFLSKGYAYVAMNQVCC